MNILCKLNFHITDKIQMLRSPRGKMWEMIPVRVRLKKCARCGQKLNKKNVNQS